MILNLSKLSFLLIQSVIMGVVSEGLVKEVTVKAYWEKIVDIENRNNESEQQSIKWIRGFKNVQSTDETTENIHRLETSAKISGEKDTELPRIFKILSLGATYSYNRQWYSHTMSQTEIYESVESTISMVIPPRSRLIRWVLVADVGGHEVNYNRFIDAVNDESLPNVTGIVKIQEPERIIFGQTRIRIKHEETRKYITVVDKDNWPVATLGNKFYFYFTLYSNDGVITIKTWNTMHDGYDMLFSSKEGAIYFEQSNNGGTQRWFVRIAGEDRDFRAGDVLYNEDVVTLRNQYWPRCYMCRKEGNKTDVYCSNHQNDRWILVVV